MPQRKPNSKSWMDTALGAVGRFGRRMRDEWKAGESEAGQPLEPEPMTNRAPASPQWWEVLQVAPAASKDEIRQAYRRLIKANHPDKAAHLSPEMQAAVERAAKLLNDAYERAMKRE